MACTFQTILSAIHKTTHIRPTVFDHSNQITFTAHVNAESTLSSSSELQKVVSLCRNSKKPHIFLGDDHLAIASLYIEKTQDVVLLGYVFLGTKSEKEVQFQLLKNFKDEELIKSYLHDIMGLRICSKSTLLMVMNLLNEYLNGKGIDEEEEGFIIKQVADTRLSSLASVTDEFVLGDQTKTETNAYDDYLFEQQLMDCIEKGDKERLFSTLKYEKISYIGSLGEIDDPLRQRKNGFICACTLATRAAIRGGMNVEQAYAMGNYYIKQNEALQTIDSVEKIIMEMFLDFTLRVASLVKINPYSAMIKQCIVYVNDHVHEAISIQEIADKIGVSKNHLLMKFKEETKQSLVDYIKNVKVAEAKLLLEFTNMPIVEISESLSFSSQSFFTAVFHQVCGITPKEYRTQQT